MRRISLRSIFWAIGLCILGLLLVFVISNSGERQHTEEFHSVKCDCPTAKKEIISKTKPLQLVTTKASNTTTAASVVTTTTTATTKNFTCKQVENSSAVQRAIIIYYPHHQSEYFFPEVRWYLSHLPNNASSTLSSFSGCIAHGLRCYTISQKHGEQISLYSHTTSQMSFVVSVVSIVFVRISKNHPFVVYFCTFQFSFESKMSLRTILNMHSMMQNE